MVPEKNNRYLVLERQKFVDGDLKIVPLRFIDKYQIMTWRNDQIYHLRQIKKLTRKDQDNYFNECIKPLFNSQKPSQLLFSYIKKDKLIGYGGMVYVDWDNLKAEISFLLDTDIKRDKKQYAIFFSKFINLIKTVAFDELSFNRLYTETYSIRENQLIELPKNGFQYEGTLRKSFYIPQTNEFCDSLIHSMINEPSK